MNQTALFHEDIYSAYRTDVQASGGFKIIGHKLRPTLKPDKAGEWLSQCLTADRPEKLSLEDQVFIKREARKNSSFAALTFEMQELSMTMPQPIEPEDKRAQLQREFINAVGQLDQIKAQLGKYAKPSQRILDTHLGSGSSAIAAHYFGCDFVGCELDPDYYKAARERFDRETRQQAMAI